MKKVPKSPRFIVTTVAVALFGLVVGSPAWGQEEQQKQEKEDLLGTYEVMAGRSHNSNHQSATYIVFKSTSLSRSYGLLFMEIQPNGYPHQPFICDDAVWSGTDKSFSCSRNFRKGNSDKRERLTVGNINGKFCNDLRKWHSDHGLPQVVVDQCTPGERCTCYEITHHDLDDHGNPIPSTFDSERGDKTGEAREERPVPKSPPGGGAGSGKGN